MNPKLTFLCFLVVTLSLASACFGQSDDAKISIQFVNTSGHPVNPKVALFFNGGRAKPIATENGIGVAPSNSGIVVAKGDGFQFSGNIVKGNEIKVVFYREDEQCEPLSQTPYPLNDQIKTKVTERIKEHLWEEVKDQPAKSMKTLQTVRVVAAIDPVGALNWLDDKDLPDQQAGVVFQPALVSLLRVDPEEAFDRVSQLEDSMSRAAVLMFFLDALPSDHSALQAVEAQMLSVTREIKQPSLRLAMRSSVAEHYVANGQPDLADKIV